MANAKRKKSPRQLRRSQRESETPNMGGGNLGGGQKPEVASTTEVKKLSPPFVAMRTNGAWRELCFCELEVCENSLSPWFSSS
jgi:hypothetical protein